MFAAQIGYRHTAFALPQDRDDLHFLADKGYFSGREILACQKAGITATVPRPDTSGSRSEGRYVKADFAYEAEADVYRCPAGEALTYRYTTEEDGLQLRRYWTTACHHCELKSRDRIQKPAQMVFGCPCGQGRDPRGWSRRGSGPCR